MAEISELLFNFWDPIGLKQVNGPNQYARYANEIVKLSAEYTDEEAVFELLKEAYVRCLGSDADDWQQTRKVSKMVCEIVRQFK